MATLHLVRCNFLVWSTSPTTPGISCGHGCGRAWGSLFEQGRVSAHCAVWHCLARCNFLVWSTKPHNPDFLASGPLQFLCVWLGRCTSSGPQAPQPQGFLVVMVAAELGGRCLSKAVSQHTVRYGHIASGPLQFPRLVHKPHNPRDFLWSWLRQSLHLVRCNFLVWSTSPTTPGISCGHGCGRAWASLFEQGRVSAHCAVWPRRIWLVAISSSGPQSPTTAIFLVGFLVVMVAESLERRCLSKSVSQHTERHCCGMHHSLQVKFSFRFRTILFSSFFSSQALTF
jgi:hypothetical protein